METQIYTPKEFPELFNLKSLSKQAVDYHLKLYDGYIKKLNEIQDEYKTINLDTANHNYSHHRSLLVEKAYNYNAVVFHEMFFENLISKPFEPECWLKEKIEKYFKSFDTYIRDLNATVRSSRTGWAVTGYNHTDDTIQNYAIDSHYISVPIKITPILVIDTWEHSFMPDYGIDKAGYFEHIIPEINWIIVKDRLQKAISGV